MINKLHELITSLILLLEEEIEEIRVNAPKNATKAKRTIAGDLAKLLPLAIQLHKLKSTEHSDDNISLTEEDEEIIRRFIERYNNEKSQ